MSRVVDKMVMKYERSFLWHRLHRRTSNPHIFLLSSAVLCSLGINFLSEFDLDTTLSSTSRKENILRHRSLLAVNDSTSESSGLYPNDIFSLSQKRQGAVVLHITGMCYMFLALSIACDEFFIPALAVITEKLNISEDVAGATFMAAGGSMPELCTSFIGVFVDPLSNVGFGTIVGSAVFNVLFVIGMCAVFSKEILHLTWWPLFRDCFFYSIALIILIGFFTDGKIEWWESLILIGTYFFYVTFMKFNHNIERWVKRQLKSNKVSAIKSKSSEKPQTGVDDAYLEKAVEMLSKAPKTNNGLPCFRYGALQLVIQTIDPLGEASIAVKVNKLKKLRSLKDRIGVEMGVENANGAQNEQKNALVEDSERQFHLSIANNSVSEDRSDSTTLSSGFKSNYTYSNPENFRTPWPNSDLEASRKSSLVNGELPHVQVVPDENTAINRPIHSPVPGMVEQNASGFRNSTTSPDSQTTSNQLVEIEDAREACLDDDSTPIDLSWPSSWKDRLAYVIRAPILFLMYFTAQDIRKPGKRHWYPWTFVWSLIWIVAFSYLMVWWAKEVGKTLQIPTEVMGLTFLAAGTSIPDLITSVLVARKGFGDMAVSSSIGSNMFDVTIGLPLPWLIFSGINQGLYMKVSSNGLFCSVSLLFIMLIAVVVTIAISKWRLSKLLGATMFLLYIVFLVLSLLLQYNEITCPSF